MELGQKVSFKYKLVKRYEGTKMLWVKDSVPLQEGVLVGLRTKYNGVVHFDYDEPPTFDKTSSVKVALVAISIRKNPFVIALDDLIVEEEVSHQEKETKY